MRIPHHRAHGPGVMHDSPAVECHRSRPWFRCTASFRSTLFSPASQWILSLVVVWLLYTRRSREVVPRGGERPSGEESDLNLMSIAIAMVSGAVAGAIAYMIAGARRMIACKFSVTFVITFCRHLCAVEGVLSCHRRMLGTESGVRSDRASKPRGLPRDQEKYEVKTYQAMHSMTSASHS